MENIANEKYITIFKWEGKWILRKVAFCAISMLDQNLQNCRTEILKDRLIYHDSPGKLLDISLSNKLPLLLKKRIKYNFKMNL